MTGAPVRVRQYTRRRHRYQVRVEYDRTSGYRQATIVRLLARKKESANRKARDQLKKKRLRSEEGGTTWRTFTAKPVAKKARK